MTDIRQLPLTWRHIGLVTVSSMEQIIGAALSTVIGIVIPMLNMMMRPELSSAVQGFMGAIDLIGIALGSLIIGPLSDRFGYLLWFRICAVLIIVGSILASLVSDIPLICIGLFVCGLGVGGGYPLDSGYISTLMPSRWRGFMVGVAKASCALGFLLPAVIALVLLHYVPSPHTWHSIMRIVTALGVVTLMLRIHWAQAPGWLLAKGRVAEAQRAAQYFFGKDVTITPDAPQPQGDSTEAPAASRNLFRGRNLLRVIYSGIPWACEGLGVYGIGVFMPILIMALGIESHAGPGIPEIIHSVRLTAWINFCIIPGFILGLWVVNRINHGTMLWTGFLGSALSLVVMLLAYLHHWPVWISIGAFMVFEIFLNAGPHLITYIIPATIFPVEIRGAGSGVANFFGKAGAILGVFFMPMLLNEGGMECVLTVTIIVMAAGALIGYVCDRLLSRK